MEVGSFQIPARGEQLCGDALLVKEDPPALIALADGLGHGPHAHEASTTFCRYVGGHADCSIEEILVGASKALASTRGAAGALMRIDEASGLISFVGVGNIAVKVHGSRTIRPYSSPGLVGFRLRKPRVMEYPLKRGLLICIYTDGVLNGFQMADYAAMNPQKAAEAVVNEHHQDRDDASCIVIAI